MTDPIHQGPLLGTLALRALARYPDRIAFTGHGPTLSYRAAHDLIGRMQAAFLAAGLLRGHRLAILTANRGDAWCASIAAQASGMSITWLHPMASLDDQADQVADGDCAALLVDEIGHGQRGGDLAARVGTELKALLTLGPAPYGRSLLALADAAGARNPRDLARADEIAILNYTGGTTGRSKGALRTQAQAADGTLAVVAGFELPRAPRYLAVAPITHVTGTKILPTLLLGGTVHLMAGFDPQAVLATLQRERISMLLAVPTMIYILLDQPELARADLSALELLLYGASPMSPARLREGLERIGPVFCQLYGQTECYPVSVLCRSDHDPARPELFASCGAPIPGVDVAILGDDDQPVPQGEAGEIAVRAPHAIQTYWKRPEQTAELFRGGWLHTGDIGRFDDRGYLYIVDRKKDMIVSGGFNVYPREVEDVLSGHPAVGQVAVIGVPDAKWGEAVTALVVPRAGSAPPPAEELIALVKSRKGGAHAPKQVRYVDALPMTAVGKVDKKVLRAQYWQGQERQVG